LRFGRMVYLGIALLSVLLLSSLYMVLLSPEDRDLSTDEKGRRGTSKVVGALKGSGFTVDVMLTTPALLLEETDPENTLYISMGRGRDFTPTEVQDLRKFYSRGGKMIIAEDGKAASSLALYYNVDYLDGQLYDERFAGSPEFVRIDVTWREFSGSLVLNEPTGIASSGGEIVARSGPSSWIDRNGNGKRDPDNASYGEFPGSKLIAMLTDPDFYEKGAGCIAFLSDPSIFANEMIEQGDNLEFVQFLVSHLLPDGGRIVIDDSTHRSSGLRSMAQGLLRGPVLLTTDINFKIVVGTLTTVLLVAIVYLYVPPPKFRHVTYLNRSGLAQLIDVRVHQEHTILMRKVVLDRARIRNSMSVDAFSALTWDQVRDLVGDDEIFEFVRGGTAKEPSEMMRRIEEWRRK
jgi:hypothetical protein